jgi:hypothetical protein
LFCAVPGGLYYFLRLFDIYLLGGRVAGRQCFSIGLVCAS